MRWETECVIAIGEVWKLAQRFPEVVYEESARVLRVVVGRLESMIVVDTPAGVGAQAGLRGSIHGEVMDQKGSVYGRVGSACPYALPVEHGRRPGKMPPVSALELWVRRKLGLPEDEARGVSFAIARKISIHGTEPVKMFEKNWNEIQDWAMAQVQTIPERVARRVGHVA